MRAAAPTSATALAAGSTTLSSGSSRECIGWVTPLTYREAMGERLQIVWAATGQRFRQKGQHGRPHTRLDAKFCARRLNLSLGSRPLTACARCVWGAHRAASGSATSASGACSRERGPLLLSSRDDKRSSWLAYMRNAGPDT